MTQKEKTKISEDSNKNKEPKQILDFVLKEIEDLKIKVATKITNLAISKSKKKEIEDLKEKEIKISDVLVEKKEEIKKEVIEEKGSIENDKNTQMSQVNVQKEEKEENKNRKRTADEILEQKLASLKKDTKNNSQQIEISPQWITKKVKDDQPRRQFTPRRDYDRRSPLNNQGQTNILDVASSLTLTKDKSKDTKKKKFDKPEKEKTISKRDLTRRQNNNFSKMLDFDEEGIEFGTKVKKNRKKQVKEVTISKIERAVVNTQQIPIKTLSEKIGQTAPTIIGKLFSEGRIYNINDSIDFELAEYIALELGTELVLELDRTAEDTVEDFLKTDYKEEDLEPRPPVVTIMGHVDHGKTSLLDYIRNAHVAQREAGGITQHIGAYTINVNDRRITFIDTPGHEAFTTMRKRGATVTDIVVIVVAVNDGIMPQTIEAISHAKQAGVSIIVAANKIDVADYDKQKMASQLAKYDLLPEEWGGDVVVCPVSAKTGQGVDNLLENIVLLSDILDLKAPKNCNAQGTIIEAKVDAGSGPLATVILKSGTLKIGDILLAGTVTGKVKAMRNESGQNIKSAGPSEAVSLLGFSEVPQAGDTMVVLDDEKIARQAAQERSLREKATQNTLKTPRTLEDFAKITQEQEQKSLSIILKCDVQGSLEAVKQSLEKLATSGDEVIKVKIVHSGVGAVNESDISLAETSSSIVIAFNIKADAKARKLSESTGIEIREYSIIYEMLNDIEKALKGMLTPKYTENILGRAEVLEIFKITGVGTIAGSKVLEGKILRNAKARLIRDEKVIYESFISSLKREKSDAKEVAKGFECGIGINNFNDIKTGDIIEAYQMDEINE